MFAYSFALVERVKAELALVKGDRKGVTALEYGLLAGLIAVAIIASVTLLGTTIAGLFGKVSTALLAA
jgi:pilus assembly protein Flp/PilA